MATKLTRTNGSPTLSTKCTISTWFKRTGKDIDVGSRDAILAEAYTDGNNYVWVRLDGDDKINVYGVTSSSAFVSVSATPQLKDPTGWYHLTVAIDSTESTSTDRVKIWLNGEQQTLTGSTYPSSIVGFNESGATFLIGDGGKYTSNFHFEGLMSHYHFIDGLAYPASTFGSTDSTSGQWSINTSPSVTYGTNGFFILKDGNSVTDQSGNTNNFTVASGTLTNTEDNPSNNFPILNPVDVEADSFTLIEGSLYSGGADNNWRSLFGTIGAKTGKYYYEVKCISSSDYERFGACTIDQHNKYKTGRYDDSTFGSEGYGYTSDGEKSNNGGTTGGYGDTWGANDILSCAIDLDNNKIYFGKNGTWQDSGDPTSGSTGTGAAYTIASDKFYIPAFASYGAAANLAFNFGNGYFRTTAISSEGTNASGIGKFEYDVPTGYTAFSTKGLNE